MPNLNKPSGITVPDITLTLADGTEHVAKPTIGDMAKFDVIRARKGWPKRDDAEVLFITVLAWIALRRVGAVSSDVDEFINQVESMNADGLDDEPEDDDTDGLGL